MPEAAQPPIKPGPLSIKLRFVARAISAKAAMISASRTCRPAELFRAAVLAATKIFRAVTCP